VITILGFNTPRCQYAPAGKSLRAWILERLIRATCADDIAFWAFEVSCCNLHSTT
jgi:hypothetical protein